MEHSFPSRSNDELCMYLIKEVVAHTVEKLCHISILPGYLSVVSYHVLQIDSIYFTCPELSLRWKAIYEKTVMVINSTIINKMNKLSVSVFFSMFHFPRHS
jgi:hypothetical protein